jgi:predicted metal-dependent peptidase
LFPSLWSETWGRVAFGCDTSGSIDQAQLKDICVEVLEVLECYAERGQDPELTVCWFDHAVYPQVVTDAADLDPKGGGGTSFGVVMDWVAKEEPLPRALVMVTDGCCNDYGEDPGIPVLWVLTRRYGTFQPPFGELTCILNN